MREAWERVRAIAQDRVHGASYLAAEAVRAVRLAVESAPRGRLPGEVAGLLEALAQARPGMAPVRNVALRLRAGLEGLDRDGALALCDSLLRRVEEGARRAAEHASRLVLPGLLVTCSYSATVVQALSLARGVPLRVVALESRFAGVVHGARTARELRAHGLQAEVWPDGAVAELMARATMALVGADRVLPDGSVLNGYPTLGLALAVHGKVPLFAVADTLKFAPTLEAAPGLELAPAGLVTGVVCELGLLRPEEVAPLVPAW